MDQDTFLQRTSSKATNCVVLIEELGVNKLLVSSVLAETCQTVTQMGRKCGQSLAKRCLFPAGAVQISCKLRNNLVRQAVSGTGDKYSSWYVAFINYMLLCYNTLKYVLNAIVFASCSV